MGQQPLRSVTPTVAPQERGASTPSAQSQILAAEHHAVNSELAQMREQLADMHKRHERTCAQMQRQQVRLEQVERHVGELRSLIEQQRPVVAAPHKEVTAAHATRQHPFRPLVRVAAPMAEPTTSPKRVASVVEGGGRKATALVARTIQMVHDSLSEQGQGELADELALLVKQQRPLLFLVLEAVANVLAERVRRRERRTEHLPVAQDALKMAARQILIDHPRERPHLMAWFKAHESLLCHLSNALMQAIIG